MFYLLIIFLVFIFLIVLGIFVTWPGKTWCRNVFVGLDCSVCAIFGGHRYETISALIGYSITNGGWASRFSWPKVWLKHFIASMILNEAINKITGGH